jgi:hypothetical protein
MKVLTFKNDTVSVGDVFVSSWGYEQTNVTFYQVLSVHGKKTVTVREIRNIPIQWSALKLPF